MNILMPANNIIIITVVTQVIIYDTSLYNDEYVIYAVHELHAVYTY